MSEHVTCAVCGKIAFELSIVDTGTEKFSKLRCGHLVKLPKLEVPEVLGYQSKSGKTLMPFQENSLEFIYTASGKALIAHEQGLGKTVISLAALAQRPEMLPALAVCKSNLAFQWMKQAIDWLPGDIVPQIISSGKDIIFPGCQIYIISYDLIRRMPAEILISGLSHVKTVILDECQHIKSTESKRTNGVRLLTRDREHIIALSGTPIKNNAAEYFSVLNILHPERFPSKKYFEHNFVDTYWDGRSFKFGGLSNEDYFREKTDDFILRYEQKDVLPDLPKFSRNFEYYDIDSDLRSAYNDVADELAAFLDEHGDNAYSFSNYQYVMAYLTKMRQITGVAKVPAAVDKITDMMENTEHKIVVFLHHHIARDLLVRNLNKWCDENDYLRPLVISDQTPAQREDIKNQFRNEVNRRIIILGTLSSGEGVDGLQDVCSKMLVLERQWNPANEEQAEKRLHRMGQENPVEALYLVAVGTVDELFTEMVERKRQITKETYGDSEVEKWDETGTVRGLVEAIISKRGGKKWQIA
jgi:SNF2 family DNA or RNA helicase